MEKEEIDGVAFEFLKFFIREGAPTDDVDVQVKMAYKYARAIADFKVKELSSKRIPTHCPICSKELKRIDVGTFDSPGDWMLICQTEGCGYTWVYMEEKIK